MSKPILVGIGGATVDLCHRSGAPLVPRDSNPGHIGFSAGGVMRNICENCARLGLRVELVTAVGDDPLAGFVLESCRAAGVGTGHIRRFCGATSSVYVSLLDETGDMALACSDMSILSQLSASDFEAVLPLLRRAAIVCLDGNPDREFLALVARRVFELGVPLFLDPVSTAHAKKFSGLLGYVHTVKPNRLELTTLSGLPTGSDAEVEVAAAALLAQGLRRVFVTLGPDGVYVRDTEGAARFYRPPPLPPGALQNATGGGDAFTAGLLSSWLDGLTLEQTLARASAAARLAVCCPETVCHELSLPRLEGIIKEVLA